jgi:hypothetical protein
MSDEKVAKAGRLYQRQQSLNGMPAAMQYRRDLWNRRRGHRRSTGYISR